MYRLLILGLIAIPLQAQDFRIAGSDLLQSVIEEPFADYAANNHDSIDLKLVGSIPALQSLRNQEVDLAIIALPSDQKTVDKRFEVIPFVFQIAIIAVHETNHLQEISLSQLAGIYGSTGEHIITQWSECGLRGIWQSRKISPTAISNKFGGVALELFKYIVLREAPIKSNITFWDDVGEGINYLEFNHTAIAVLPGILPREDIKFLSIAKEEEDFAFGPTPENIYFGDYPLRLPFYLVFESDNRARLKGILKLLLSDGVAEHLDQNYFLSLPQNVRRQLSLDLDLR